MAGSVSTAVYLLCYYVGVACLTRLPRGQQEEPSKNQLPEYDSNCFLCPANIRAQGDRNPDYRRTFAFVNDYSAVKEEQAEYDPPKADAASSSTAGLRSLLLKAAAATGKCYVLTFSEKHHLTLADMPAQDILPVIQTWTRIYASHLAPNSPLSGAATTVLQSLPSSADDTVAPPVSQLRYMQIFENKGAAMGCSNPHPHCQIWTTSSLPEEPGKELEHMSSYLREHGRHILGDYVQLEMEEKERIVWQNDAFLVVCPWWAIWPFEVLVIAKRHARALVDLTADERLRFAEAIQEVARRYDNLFRTSFPYSKLAAQAPKGLACYRS